MGRVLNASGDSSSRPSLRSSRIGVVAAVFAAVLALASSVVGLPVSAASAQTGGTTSLVITGRGWGHGRGMGQYGALGYAQDYGWSSAQILDHFYGGTVAGPAPADGVIDPAQIRVDLRSMRGRATEVALTSGDLHVYTDAGTVVRATGAVRISPSGDGFTVAVADDCGGDFVDTASASASTVKIQSESTADGADGLLQVCGASRTWYDGEIWATIGDGQQRTVNAVDIDSYLRGVVPREVPALWPAAALEAQSVAARSYALAGDTRWGDWADSCDTTLCQVYEGRFTTRRGSFQISTHERTDAAITATAGLVRLRTNGAVARTEFSSSTGGWTVGWDFTAVEDLGDAVAANPNHTWRVVVNPRSLEQRYNRGTLLGIGVVERQGDGPNGGRAIEVELRFTGGTVTESANTIRRVLGLKSDWFHVGAYTLNGVVQAPIDPAAVANYVEQVHQRLGGRTPTAAEASQWSQAINEGRRADAVRALVRGADHAGLLLDDLYADTFGRPADSAGKAYWVERVGSGLRYEQLGTLFYGSAEYFHRSGGTNESFVDALYRDLLGRSADPAGKSYWVDQLAAGQTIDVVAHSFYRSVESRGQRAAALHQRLYLEPPSAAELERLTERLVATDDFDLTVELAVEMAAEAAVYLSD